MSRGLPLRMLVGLLTGLVLGVAAHLWLGDSPALERFVRTVTEPAGKIFLRLLFMLVIPLILSGLALGVSGVGDLGRLGRIGIKTLLYTVVVSTLAVLLGVGMVNLFRPGEGLSPALRQRLLAHTSAVPAAAATGTTGVDFLVNLVPANIVKAMSDGDMLARSLADVVGWDRVRGVGEARLHDLGAQARETLDGRLAAFAHAPRQALREVLLRDADAQAGEARRVGGMLGHRALIGPGERFQRTEPSGVHSRDSTEETARTRRLPG